MSKYKELKVWQKAMNLVESIYSVTRNFPKEEKYSLVSQMRRPAISIPSNIAEGAGRGSKKEYIQFLTIAYGSSRELETQSILCQRLGMLTSKQANEIQEELGHIGRMLLALQKALAR